MSFYTSMSDEDLHDFFAEKVYTRYKSDWASRLGVAKNPVPFRGNVYGFAATPLEKMLSFQYWQEGKNLAAEAFGVQDSLPDIYILGPIKRIFKGCIFAMERDLLLPEGFMDKESINKLVGFLTMESFLSREKRESLYATSKTMRETHRAKRIMAGQSQSLEMASLVNYLTSYGLEYTGLVKAFHDSMFGSVTEAIKNQNTAQQELYKKEVDEDINNCDDCD